MKTYNEVKLIGYVAAEPVENDFKNGTRCVNVTLKTNDYYGNKEERKVDRNFHNLIFWNGIGDMATTILKKGDLLFITGRLKNRKIEVKDEKPIYKTEIVVSEWTKLNSEESGD